MLVFPIITTLVTFKDMKYNIFFSKITSLPAPVSRCPVGVPPLMIRH